MSLKTLRSKSVLGLSSVVLIFQEGTDLMRARQLTQERLATVAGQLPAVAHPPVILSPLSSASRVMKIGMSSETLSQMEMTTLARWTIRPRLMAIPGVANVAIRGQRDRQIQVLVDPDNLRAHNVTLDSLVQTARDAISPGAGGFIDMPNQRLAVTHLSPIARAKDLERIPVTFRDGSPLQLGDVADVVEGHPAPIGDAVINDGPGLLLIVEKQPQGNTLDVTRNVEAALNALRPGLKDVEMDSTIFRPATFIRMALHNLNRALLIGCILVVIVLIAFLYDWRTALISLLAIPLSHVRADIESLRQISITLPSGGDVPLGEVADVHIAPTPNVIQRENASRRIDVSCDVKGRDLGSVAREIESKVRALPFDRGYHPEFLGEYAAKQQSRNRLLALAALSLLGILLLLHADFRSPRLVALIFVSLPFALGGVIAVLLTGGVLSLGSLVGFVTVLGIAARNGIMLVSHYRHLEFEEGQPFGEELVLRGSEERIAPILMTALATGLALLPIVIGGNRPGHEIEHPLAVVILGGLVTSTLLNLFLMPALYPRFGSSRKASRKLAEAPADPEATA